MSSESWRKKYWKAVRLDQSDAFDIDTPSALIANVGCHYDSDHINYLINEATSSGKTLTWKEAIQQLEKDKTTKYYNKEKENSTLAAVNAKTKSGAIDLSTAGLKTWVEANGYSWDAADTFESYNTQAEKDKKTSSTTIATLNTPVIKASTLSTASTSDSSEPSTEEKRNVTEEAAANKTETPAEAIVKILKPGATGEVTFPEKEYIEWMLPLMNEIARKDAKEPQIPTSILTSISVARTGFKNTDIGGFNFWKVPYNSELTSLKEDNGYCAFKDFYEGARALLTICHSKTFKDAVAELPKKMGEATEEQKVAAAKAICMLLDSSEGGVTTATKAKEWVDKYKMRDWDTDKTKAEGGHADDYASNSDKSGNQSPVARAISQAMQLVSQAAHKIGGFFMRTPVSDQVVMLTMIPQGRTIPTEPVYPDYLNVGSTVPQWVYTQIEVEALKEAEEEAFKAAGIQTIKTEDAEITAFNKALDTFKNEQFVKWCKDNNVKYKKDTEKEAAKKLYADAASKNEDGNFTDGIYMKSSTDKAQYQALQKKKQSLLADSVGVSVAQAASNYQASLSNVKAEIQNREGSWNQDKGQPFDPSAAGITTVTTDSAGGSNVSTVQVGADVSAIEKAVAWAIAIANDQSHGYSQANRTGPDYDCSSFVYTALMEGGGFTKFPYAGTADTIENDIKKYYGDVFDIHNNISSSFSFKRGDVLVRKDRGHLGLATSATEHVAAHSAFGHPETGDQSREIDVSALTGSYWAGGAVIRYKGTVTATVTGQPGSSPTTADIEKWITWAQNIADDSSHGYSQEHRDGPDYDCSSLVYWAMIKAGFTKMQNAWNENPQKAAREADGSNVRNQQVGDADCIADDLLKYYSSQFTKTSISATTTYQRGDILINKDGSHCAFAISNSKTVEARGQSYGKPATGDQGTEVGNFDIGTRFQGGTLIRYKVTTSSSGG